MALHRTLMVLGARSWCRPLTGCVSRPGLGRHTSTTADSEIPEMPPCDFKPQPYTGMSYEDTRDVRKTNLNPGIVTYYSKPVLIHQGYMQYLYDNTGKRYLDLFAGIVTVGVGHCHPKVNARLKEQVDKLWHTTNIYMHPGIHEYAKKLTAKLPGDLKVVYFTNSGSEANDLAMFMARLYTGAFDVISMRNAYHGASPYITGLTALSSWNYQIPYAFGIHHTMNPDVYRGPWGGSNCRDSLAQPLRECSCTAGCCQASDMYVDQLKDVLNHSCPKRIAAFFAEPIQGVGGAVQLPKGFLKNAFQAVRERGGVCIADEVQTGFGRLGSHYWGFESQDATPDIVTMAKGIGNGFPLAAVVTTPEIAECMGKSLHFNTYGGNPLACAVGSAVLDVIDEEGTQANSARVGEVFVKELLKLREEFEVVGDVRGKGLMLGVELVKSKTTREPLPAVEVGEIWENCKDNGVLIGKGGLYGTALRIKPPMCINEDDVHFGIAVMRKALKDHEKNH